MSSTVMRLSAALFTASLAVTAPRWLPAAGNVTEVHESVEVADHLDTATGQEVNGATVLIRDFTNRRMFGTLSSQALEPGHAYSVWAAVFNHPRRCAVPAQCGPADVEINGGDPSVRTSIFWVSGFVADQSGHGGTTFEILPGRTNRPRAAASQDYGLENMRAEIHITLRDHGPAGVSGDVSDQISSLNDACPPAGCVNAFASIHPPRD